MEKAKREGLLMGMSKGVSGYDNEYETKIKLL